MYKRCRANISNSNNNINLGNSNELNYAYTGNINDTMNTFLFPISKTSYLQTQYKQAPSKINLIIIASVIFRILQSGMANIMLVKDCSNQFL